MNIIDKPYDQFQLRALSKDGRERVAGVVAVAWHELLGREAEAFEEDMCRRLTGSRYGLEDLAVKLVGCLGQDVLLEGSGLVATFLENYDEWMASEQAEETHEQDA